ncbi:hypothetical protein [Poriferisphaera sp. WC338]|uniref:hypothetical protein n=1 Tax=Poriferisphaera sp. WC338 TaxID=3425129 RepID=UPI003D81C496
MPETKTYFAIILTTAIIALTFAALSITPQSLNAKTKQSDGILIHITSNIHTPEHQRKILTALNLAVTLADDHNVRIFCDAQGINLLLEENPSFNLPMLGSTNQLINQLIDKNVPIYASLASLQAQEYVPEQLQQGIQIAEKSHFFSFPNPRVITLDY